MANALSLVLGVVLFGRIISGCGTSTDLLPLGTQAKNSAEKIGTKDAASGGSSATKADATAELGDFKKTTVKKNEPGKAAEPKNNVAKKPEPAAPAPAPAVVPAAPAAPVLLYGFCEILQASREKVYFNPSTSEEACRLTCANLEGSNPFRECSYNGIIFRQTPTAQCLIVGSGGKVHYNALTQPQPCKDVCASLEATNPLRTCTWQGLVLRAP